MVNYPQVKRGKLCGRWPCQTQSHPSWQQEEHSKSTTMHFGISFKNNHKHEHNKGSLIKDLAAII